MTDELIPDDIMQAETDSQLRDAISVAIDDFVGKLHSEKITSITEIIAAERAKCEAELATLRAENELLWEALRPFADIPAHGAHGGHLVAGQVWYEDGSSGYGDKTHSEVNGAIIPSNSIRRARAALKGGE